MKLTALSQLAMKHARSSLGEELYLKTGYDATKPINFYGLVNERCNYKCRYCEYWRMKEYADEMSIDQWKTALTSVQDFVGKFFISFSGGEPFIKKGFVDLLKWCGDAGIDAGVTTNGSALNPEIVKKIVDAKPFNVNISCDAPNAEVHDYVRGAPGSFDKIVRGVDLLLKEREARGQDFPIIIKTVVQVNNFRILPDHVRWVKGLGAAAVNFQPMDEWTDETKDELWIPPEMHGELQEVVDRLIEMKRQGAPILNSETILGLMVPHFRNEKAPDEARPCRVGLRNFFIRTNGNIEVCFFYPPIGNIKENSAREIWYGEKAAKIRKQTVECDKLCLYTCLSQKTMGDKLKMGLTLLAGGKTPISG